MSNIETGTGASRVLFINSQDTQLQTTNPILTTDYLFIPDEAITVPPHHTILMSLHHTSIPFSFYNFQRGRNVRLDFTTSAYNTTAGADTGFIELTAGNYNARSLMDAIVSKINTATGGTLAMVYDRDTLKYNWRWTGSGAGNQRLTLRIANGANAEFNFKDEIGFNKNVFVEGIAYDVYFENNGVNFRCGFSDNAASTQLFTTTSADFWGGDNTAGTQSYFSVVDVNAAIRSLYVRTNLTQHSILDSAVGGGFSSILARIPIDVNSGGIITISPSDGSVHKLILKVKEITAIGVRLTDQKNRLINLNGLDWDISLQFDFIEKVDLKIPKDKRLEIHERLYKEWKDEDEYKKEERQQLKRLKKGE